MWWILILLSLGVIVLLVYCYSLLSLISQINSEEESRIDRTETIPPRGMPVMHGDEHVWVIQCSDTLYYVLTRKDMNEAVAWLENYNQYGIICAACDSLIFPMHPVGKIGQDYYHGGEFECAPPGTDWGVLDADGTPIPTRVSGLTLAEEVFMKRVAVIETIETTMPTLNDCDYVLYGIRTVDKSQNYG